MINGYKLLNYTLLFPYKSGTVWSRSQLSYSSNTCTHLKVLCDCLKKVFRSTGTVCCSGITIKFNGRCYR